MHDEIQVSPADRISESQLQSTLVIKTPKQSILHLTSKNLNVGSDISLLLRIGKSPSLGGSSQNKEGRFRFEEFKHSGTWCFSTFGKIRTGSEVYPKEAVA